MTDFVNSLKERLRNYANPADAGSWLSKNNKKLEKLFSNVTLRDFIFEPVKDVFRLNGKDEQAEIYSAITRVAVANAVLAGIPGKMGIGVVVSIALEAWMAYVIAKRVGIKITSTADIWKYMGLLAATLTTILWIFKSLLGFGFSIFSIIPGINPLILAELFVTNFIGLSFYAAWKEAKYNNSFAVPKRAFKGIWSETKSLYAYQTDILKRNLSPSNLKSMGLRLRAWLKGEIPVQNDQLRGELFSTLAMGWLLAGQYDRLDGPLAQEFVSSIRDRYPELEDASLFEISEFMSKYEPEQMIGVINLIKGKLFERIVTKAENDDQDLWKAHMHDDETFPGSDIVLTNEETGETLEISLKATENPYYIENALLRYPDIPILTTDEVKQYFEDNSMIMASGYQHSDLHQVTQENFDFMLNKLSPTDALEVTGTGVIAGTIMGLWPFVMAYYRKRISQEQLQQACERVFGESGIALASRLSYAVILGPVFAWYLLARGVIGITTFAENTEVKTHKVSYIN